MRKPKANQRESTRFFLLGAGSLQVEGSAIPIDVLNRSRSGIFIASPLELPLGTQVELHISQPEALTLRCRVVRKEVWGGAGSFLFGMQLKAPASADASLERWVRFNRELLGGALYGKPATDLAHQRSYRRTTVPLATTIEMNGEEFPGTILNLNEKGIGLLSLARLSKGESYRLAVSLPDLPTPARLLFKVNWAGRPSPETPVGLGLEILGFQGDGKQTWERSIQDDLIVLF